MASAGINARIVRVFENLKTVDIDDIYDCDLITNGGFHKDAKEFISSPAKIEVKKETVENTAYVELMIPLHYMIDDELISGTDLDLVAIATAIGNADLEMDTVLFVSPFVVGEEVVVNVGYEYPNSNWLIKANNEPVIGFEYTEEQLNQYFGDGDHIVFYVRVLDYYNAFKFKKSSDGTISFVQGAVLEPIT